MMDSTLTTAVSSLKWSGWRGTEQFSDFCRAAQSWAGTWRGRPWASTKERAMQAIPETAGNVFKRPTSNHQSLGRSLVFSSYSLLVSCLFEISQQLWGFQANTSASLSSNTSQRITVLHKLHQKYSCSRPPRPGCYTSYQRKLLS